MITSLVRRKLIVLFSLACDIYAVFCGWFPLPPGMIGRLSSVIVALLGHLVYFYMVLL